MKVWNSFPMLRLIVPFLFGVVSWAFIIELYTPSMLEVSLAGIAVLISGLILWFLSKIGRRPHLFGWAIRPILYVLGALLTVSHSDHLFPDHLISKGNENVFLAKVCEEPRIKANSIEVVADVSDTDNAVFGKVVFYFDPDSFSQKIKYGHELIVRSQIDRVVPQGNPIEFNYQRYLRFHNILFRGFVRSGDWEQLSNGQPGVFGWFYDLRSSLITKFKEAQIDGDALSVASALILGYRAELDRELMAAYAGAGATHVLAVSGLHVGIVYVIINTLLRFMDRHKYLKWLKTLLLISILFGYAALTGLSASVFRAATMFAFVAIGKAFSRSTNIYNTLAASAFCLILYDPMIVMQVGFQLSYAAVFGIVLIQPRLFELIAFENRFLDWAWSITCVSVAAQIATFPLGLLYFHQFPNLFLVSNLLVIPAAAIILYLGFSLFLFSFWKPTLLFFGFLLETIIELLNRVVMWIEQIPYSVLTGIDISTFESLLIYCLIGSLLILFLKKRVWSFHLALSFSIVFMIFQIAEVFQQNSQKFITIYNVRKETVLALFNGTQLEYVSSPKFHGDDNAKLFNVLHHWWHQGVATKDWYELSDSLTNRQISWSGWKFAILDLKCESGKHLQWTQDDSLDFAVVHYTDWNSIEQFTNLKTRKLIISNNIGTKTKERLKGVPDIEVGFTSEGAVVLR